MKTMMIFFFGLICGIGFIVIYNKLIPILKNKKPPIKISPVQKSFDELIQIYNSISQDTKKNLEEYSSFPTIEHGKLLAADLFTQVTVCLSILSSLEKFGIDTKSVFDELLKQ